MVVMRASLMADGMLPTWAVMAGYEIEADSFFPFHLFLVYPRGGWEPAEGEGGKGGKLRVRGEGDILLDLGGSPSMMDVWEAVERDARRCEGVVA